MTKLDRLAQQQNRRDYLKKKEQEWEKLKPIDRNDLERNYNAHVRRSAHLMSVIGWLLAAIIGVVIGLPFGMAIRVSPGVTMVAVYIIILVVLLACLILVAVRRTQEDRWWNKGGFDSLAGWHQQYLADNLDHKQYAQYKAQKEQAKPEEKPKAKPAEKPAAKPEEKPAAAKKKATK